jgi:hypothetical protein
MRFAKSRKIRSSGNGGCMPRFSRRGSRCPRALRNYGAPEAIVTDSGGVFYSKRAMAIYEAASHPDRADCPRQSWQNYREAHFGIMRRLADYYLNKAPRLPEMKKLNAEGLQTVKGRSWSAHRVMDFRLSNVIPSGFTVNPQLRLMNNGYLTTAEAAARLEINQTTVQKWYKLGLLQGKHTGGKSALWIVWTEEAEQRLGGQASFDSRMTSVKSLCKLHGKTWEQVIRWCMEEGHQIYRLRRGTTFRFYVLPASCSLQP